ncbi:MAG: TetR/AcrR family transcriptional regulator [Calothrix sp. MO_167.B42]|nr:TetR/AcrR family transcriptional regulator [Calothrix sp. MO_167.B42]
MARTKVSSKISNIDRDHSINKVDKILQGAMQEFLENGYAGTSMDKVAAAAGVSKATVYSYFKDKEALFKALMEQRTRQKFQSVLGKQPLEGEPKMILRYLATKGLEQMTQDKEHRALMRVIIGESGRFPKLAQVCVLYMMKPMFDTLSHYLSKHPELNLPDPEAAARIFLGSLVHFYITQEVLHGKHILPMANERFIDSLVDLVLSHS